MRFKTFTIPTLEPDTHCNTRVWVDGQEGYCQVETGGTRCPQHDVESKRKRWAATRKGPTLAERVAELKRQGRSIINLDEDILGLTALIDLVLDQNRPGTLSLVARLMLTKAQLIETKINIREKMRVALHADFLWEKMLEITKKTIGDRETRRRVELEYAQLLDELVEAELAKTSLTEISESESRPTEMSKAMEDDDLRRVPIGLSSEL